METIGSGHRPVAHPLPLVHRMFELVEPIATLASSGAVTTAFRGLGLRGYWDGYFAGRAAPLGTAPPEVVHAVFYNFAPGEVARHIPWVWERTTPAEAIAVRERSCAAELRRRLGDRADDPGVAGLANVLTRAAQTAPTEGRALFAGLRALPVPTDPVARLWHAANLLREHRGDSHNAVLVAHGVGGTESHVLFALALGERVHEFSRLSHLPPTQVDRVVDGLRERGLIDADGLTDSGRALRERVETRTDELAAAAYAVLDTDELSTLIAGLESLTAAV